MRTLRKRGQRRPDGTVVIKQDAPGGMRKIRCPKCQNLAVPTVLPNGKERIVCPTCGAVFTSTAM